MPRCFIIHPTDNVATMLDDVQALATLEILGTGGGGVNLAAGENIGLGHKVAIMDIPDGKPVIKYGVSIGLAAGMIRRGQWVHLHNCSSHFDVRSGTLDLHSGAATDTRYE